MNEQDTLQAESTDEQQADPAFDGIEGLLDEAADASEQLGDPDEHEDESDEGDEAKSDDKPEAEPEAKADDAEIALDDGRKVTVRELKETFSTFTRKTQELAETQRNTLAQARQAVAQHAEQQAHTLHLMAQRMDQLAAPGFDEQALQNLAFTNPEQFYQVKARLDVAAQMRQGIQSQVQAALKTATEQKQLAEQESQQAHAELLQSEGAKLAAQKWFNDDFKAKAVAFARKHGIPENTARGVAYAGFIEITRKAMLFDEAQARAKSGKQPPAPQRMAPGSTPARGQMNRAKDLKTTYDRARESKRPADIGRFLDKIL